MGREEMWYGYRTRVKSDATTMIKKLAGNNTLRINEKQIPYKKTKDLLFGTWCPVTLYNTEYTLTWCVRRNKPVKYLTPSVGHWTMGVK